MSEAQNLKIMHKLSRVLMPLVKFGLAAGLLLYLFNSGRFDLQSLKIIYSPKVLFWGLLLVGLVLFLSSERWRLLLKQQKLESTSSKTFSLTLIGAFFNFFVPGGVGGDVVKALIVAQNHTQKRGQAVLTVLADRILGLFTMTTLALFAFAFETKLLQREPAFQYIFWGLFILFIGFILTFWILLSEKTEKLRQSIDQMTQKIPRLQKLWRFAQTYRLKPRELGLLFLISLSAQMLQIVFFILIAQESGFQVTDPSVFLFAVPVGFMVTAIPIAPAGIGVGQAAFAYLFTKSLGFETSVGIIGITASQFFQLIYGLVGAVLFVLLKRNNPTVEKTLHQET